jgi:hypothetical protein
VLQVSAADLVVGTAAGKGNKHHYIPVFYTKGWSGQDGRVCQYSRPFQFREVKPRRVHPDGTGYIRTRYHTTMILASPSTSSASSSR